MGAGAPPGFKKLPLFENPNRTNAIMSTRPQSHHRSVGPPRPDFPGSQRRTRRRRCRRGQLLSSSISTAVCGHPTCTCFEVWALRLRWPGGAT